MPRAERILRARLEAVITTRKTELEELEAQASNRGRGNQRG